ncbi:phosphotransferase [Nocardia zapadnayensis]|nr:phosphotransferase [Nocardia zapadnayensis]MCX0277885.1 phosphotransferase [Nocardia zapadnayensis]
MTRPLHSLAPEEIVGLCAAQFGVDVVFEESLPGLAAINVLLRAELGQPDRPGESDHPEQTDAVEQAGDPGQPPARFVLKAEYPSPTMTPAHFDWVCRTQEQARAAGLPIAAQVPARTPFTDPSTGESSGALALVDVDGTPAMVRLHAFLPGQEAAAARSGEYPGLAGALAARMTNALADAPAEPAPVVHPWSFVATGANVLSLCDRINALEAAGQVPQEFGTPLSADLAIVRAHAQEFEQSVRPALAELPHQVVHQDLNDSNILLSSGRVSGVIDFNDSATAPRLAELAIAAASAMIGQSDPAAALTAARRAYQAEAAGTSAALDPAESALVEHAALTRLALIACTWTARAITAPPEHPHARTGRARMRSTWPVLRAVLGS